jgi:hypothetical protein
MSGFLVVFSSAPDVSPRRRYAGVNRVPPYPAASDTEAEAMEEYVLGDVKDVNTNLIPSLQEAVRLCHRLSRGGRRFEIIYCGYVGSESPPADLRMRSAHHLGYDVAVVQGDYWSIVRDLPPTAWVQEFRLRLNENGLFGIRNDAETYLREYRAHREADHEMPLDVVSVSRVVPR